MTTDLETVLKRVARRIPSSVIPTTTVEINPSEWLTLTDEIERLREELDIERMRLAACGTAALGYFQGCDPKYDSASLQDVLRLRAKLTGDSHG